MIEAIELNREEIPWKTNVKYLGVTIDSKLRFNALADRIQEGTKLRGYLHPMLGWHSKVPISV